MRGCLRLIRLGLTALGALVFLVTMTPCTSWWAQRMAGPVYASGGEVLIVLAGSTVDDQYLGESSYWRCIYTVLAWRQGQFSRILISGKASAGTPAAVLMQQFLVAHGVDANSIIVESESTSTRENAQRSAPLLAGMTGRKALLTSDYHIPRALAVFRREGLEVEPLPAPDASKRGSHWRGRWPAFLDLCVESGSWLWYRLRGWI